MYPFLIKKHFSGENNNKERCILENKRYVRVIERLMSYYNISEQEFQTMLSDREYRYMLLLLLKENNCININKLKKLLNLRTRTSIINNLNKAEEKLLINKEFRECYFELDNIIKK